MGEDEHVRDIISEIKYWEGVEKFLSPPDPEVSNMISMLKQALATAWANSKGEENSD